MKPKFLLLAATLSLSACVPTLSRRTFAPMISGVLLRDGTPVPDAELLLTASWTDTTASAKTDSSGRFQLGPLTERQFVRSVFGDRVYVYKLGIRVAGEPPSLGYEGRDMGALPDNLHLTCDLSKMIGKGASARHCSRDRHQTPPVER